MRFTSSRRLVMALVVGATAFAQQIPVIEKTLPNGMRVLMVERHDKPTVACGWVAKVGSANERPGITGLAHLFEHMMFKGTETIGTKNGAQDLQINARQDAVQAEIRKEMDQLRERKRRGEIPDMHDPKVRTPRLQQLLDEFNQLVTEQKANIVKDEMAKLYTKHGSTGLNAFTSTDMTVYINEVPSNKLELWMWLDSDRLAKPVFREFYSERNVVLEERKQTGEATPTGNVDEAFRAMLWTAHPYATPVVGWASDISQVTREQANDFFTTYYAPNNITAVLVGDFNPDHAMALMQRYFGRLKANPKGVPPVITEEPAQLAEQRMNAEVHASTAVQVHFKAVAAVHKDAPALKVLGNALNGRSGRIAKELVVNQKVATEAGAGFSGSKYAGSFYFSGLPAPGKKPEDVEKALYAEIEKIQKEGISDRELQKVKNQSQASAFRQMENNMGLMIQLAQAEANGNYKDFLEAPRALMSVTVEDVKRVAKAYFSKENRSVLTYTRKEAK